MRVYTCTPKRFAGDDSFFTRESGLLCIGLQSLGIESMAIMPGPEMEGDQSSLLRTDYSNLTNPNWWRELQIDGLILYSWASPAYNDVARAVSDAGIPFIVNMDTSGLISRLSNPKAWWRESFINHIGIRSSLCGKGLQTIKWLIDSVFNITARRRIVHYDSASFITSVTPLGKKWIENEMSALGRSDLTLKVRYLPHPQKSFFTYNQVEKQNRVISVGRWSREAWHQKNPSALLESLLIFLKSKPDWNALIIGKGAKILVQELRIQPCPELKRIDFIEAIPTENLANYLQGSKIGFWTSRYEGQQGTAAQALCCGCSVVAPAAASMSCFAHYISAGSGRLGLDNSPRELANQLLLEAQSWEQGDRDAEQISARWCDEFHDVKVAARALKMLNLNA